MLLCRRGFGLSLLSLAAHTIMPKSDENIESDRKWVSEGPGVIIISPTMEYIRSGDIFHCEENGKVVPAYGGDEFLYHKASEDVAVDEDGIRFVRAIPAIIG